MLITKTRSKFITVIKLSLVFILALFFVEIFGLSHAMAVCSSTLNINQDGEYGFTGGVSTDFSISVLANGATSGALVDKGSYYLLDTSKFLDDGNVMLTWQLNNNTSGTYAYYGYEVRRTIDNGLDDYEIDAGGNINNEGTNIKCAMVYSTIASNGAHYGENWNCDNATCAGVSHNYTFDPREYSGKILKFSVTEKFNQPAGGTSIYDNFIRYLKPILVDVPAPDTQYNLHTILKDRANNIDTSSTCGTYCENRNGTYYLKNGEVYIPTNFVADESGNLQSVLTAFSRQVPWQSSVDGSTWTDNATLMRVATAEGGEVNFEGINTEGQDYYNNALISPFRLRSGVRKATWQIRKSGILTNDSLNFNYADYGLTVNDINLQSDATKLAVNLPTISYEPDIVLTDNNKSASITLKNSNNDSYPANFSVATGKFFNTDGSSYDNYYTSSGETRPSWLNAPNPTLDNLNVDRTGKNIEFALAETPNTNQAIYSSINSAIAFPEVDSSGKIACADSVIQTMVNNSLQKYIDGTTTESYVVSQAKASDEEAVSYQCQTNAITNPCSYARAKISYQNANLPTCELKANQYNPLKIGKGTMVDLSWITNNAESIQVDNGVGVIGPVASGSIPLGAINGTVNFTMTATNKNGSSTCSVLINVTPAPTCTINAPCVKKDSEFDLSYSTYDADSAIINPNSVFAEVGTSKTVHISNKISDKTTYTMTAANASGTGTCSVDVAPQDTCNTRDFQGIFIAGKIDDKTGDSNVIISQDSHVINNPPPGFNDLFAPLWQELVP